MATSNLPKEFFSQFHDLFKGDTFELCQSCGGCEYAAIAALLPGEAAYIAEHLPAPLSENEFRKRYVDEIIIPKGKNFSAKQRIEVLKLVAPCPFLNMDGSCMIRAFKPVLCEIYPLLLTVRNDRIIAEVDDWCPLGNSMVQASLFLKKWQLVSDLFQALDPNWVKATEVFDPFTYDFEKLASSRKNKNNEKLSINSIANVQVCNVLKCKIDDVNAREVIPLYSNQSSWKRMQGELLHCMQAEFPASICCAIRNMMESRSLYAKIQELVKAAESIALLCANIMLAHYICYLREAASDSVNTKLNAKIRKVLFRASFGTTWMVVRELSKQIYGEKGIQHFIPELPKALIDLCDIMDPLISLRNDIAHLRIPLPDNEAARIYPEALSRFLKIVRALTFLKDYAMVSPKEVRQGKADLLVSRGTGRNLLYWQDVFIVDNLEVDKVYLLNLKSGASMSLWPFYTQRVCDLCVAPRIFRIPVADQESSYETKYPTTLIDEIDGHNQSIESADLDLAQYIEPLSPDFRYQRLPYLAGYSMRALRQVWRLDIINEFGDLRTEVDVELEKIRFEDNHPDSEDDVFPMDYHDCPDYPIDDATFDLKVMIDGVQCDDCAIHKTIWNHGFRQFGVKLGKRLQLGETCQVKVSMFEPELMKLWPDDVDADERSVAETDCSPEDYYEIAPSTPIEEGVVQIVFPNGYKPYNLKLFADEIPLQLGKSLKRLDVQQQEDGRYAVEYQVSRPMVEHTYILRYSIGRPPLRPVYSGGRNAFQTGLSMQRYLTNHSACSHWASYMIGPMYVVEQIEKVVSEKMIEGRMLSILDTDCDDQILIHGNEFIARRSLIQNEISAIKSLASSNNGCCVTCFDAFDILGVKLISVCHLLKVHGLRIPIEHVMNALSCLRNYEWAYISPGLLNCIEYSPECFSGLTSIFGMYDHDNGRLFKELSLGAKRKKTIDIPGVNLPLLLFFEPRILRTEGVQNEFA